MASRVLPPDELVTRCDPDTLCIDAADSLPDRADGSAIVGQDRARAAIDFAIAMRRPGYHLFVMGPPGTGKRSLVHEAVDAQVRRERIQRSDWVYVHNFEQPNRPVALQLAAGRGAELRADMRALIDDLRTTIPAAFDSEEYASTLERLNAEFKERTEQGIGAVGDEAQRHGIVMIHTPAGFTFAPKKGDDVMSTQDFEALPAEEKTRIQQAVAALQDRLLHALRASLRLRKEHADRLRALNRSTTELAVGHAVDEAKARYADLADVCRYLEAVRVAVIDNADAFRSQDEAGSTSEPHDLARYAVNLVVDAGGSDGAAIVEADLPTTQNLVGRIDHIANFGMLVTDFRHIQAGLLHRANGGYLLIDAVKLLTQPFAWSSLKRALQRGEVRIESPAEIVSLVSTIQLEPMPIPLEVKVVLFGERAICQLLQAYDPEFDSLFRVVADVGDDLPRQPGTQRALARTLAAQAQAQSLLRPSASALAGLIDHGARLSGDATRIGADVRRLLDVLHEADHLARAAQRQGIEAVDVAAAIGARRERAARVDERLRSAMLRDILAIATSGAQVGQINGLAAYQVGDEVFGMPARISATARLGEGQVVDIQRETRLGGPLHAKGVLILGSFLAARYCRLQPYSIAGSVVFEQTYGLVEGDSASLAELVALLSAIGGVPIRQCLAMTGSVDQFGKVQAIGAVNEKVEAFFDLCAARGLDGTHGAIIPHSNASQLMLRDDVVAAVAAGRFALHAVRTVDDALELLTGLDAGDAASPRDDTVNGRIAMRLGQYSAIRRNAPRFVRGRKPRRLAPAPGEAEP